MTAAAAKTAGHVMAQCSGRDGIFVASLVAGNFLMGFASRCWSLARGNSQTTGVCATLLLLRAATRIGGLCGGRAHAVRVISDQDCHHNALCPAEPSQQVCSRSQSLQWSEQRWLEELFSWAVLAADVSCYLPIR